MLRRSTIIYGTCNDNGHYADDCEPGNAAERPEAGEGAYCHESDGDKNCSAGPMFAKGVETDRQTEHGRTGRENILWWQSANGARFERPGNVDVRPMKAMASTSLPMRPNSSCPTSSTPYMWRWLTLKTPTI